MKFAFRSSFTRLYDRLCGNFAKFSAQIVPTPYADPRNTNSVERISQLA
ncbi:hypothetical protein AAIB41_03700 [Brucella sp. BE17]